MIAHAEIKMHLTKSKIKITITFFLVLSFLSFYGYSSAATFKVSTTSEFRQALLDAAGNGEDDTIILDAGTYKTTDDGQGTFTFSGTEAYNLTIKAKDGLTRNDVILDGDNTDQVLNFANTETDSVLTVDSITVQNGYIYYDHGTPSTGGIDSSYKYEVVITNSIISGNAGEGISSGKVTVTNSIVSENSGRGIEGGDVTVANSIISENNNGGIASGGNLAVISSTISGNALEGYGGGIFCPNTITVTNSTISGNTANDYSGPKGSYVPGKGGGIYCGSSDCGGGVTVINSTISGNTADSSGGGIYGNGNFINNIFTDNSSDIRFGGDSNLYNNFIDNTKLENESSFVITKENNIQPNAGSLHFADSDFRLGKGSIAINKGLDPNSNKFKSLFTDSEMLAEILQVLKTDKDGNQRIRGKSIDLGAYEYWAFTITASAGVGGSIKPKGNVKVTYGTDRTFTITPKKDYKIAKVKVDGVSVGAVKAYTFSNITKNHSISATFKKK